MEAIMSVEAAIDRAVNAMDAANDAVNEAELGSVIFQTSGAVVSLLIELLREVAALREELANA